MASSGSNEYSLYREMFPQHIFAFGGKPLRDRKEFERICDTLKNRFDELKAKYGDRFKFDVVNGVFTSFLKSKPVIPKLDDIGTKKMISIPKFHEYKHDNVVYRATVEGKLVGRCDNNDCYGTVRRLTLRLANNGFLYLPDTDESLSVHTRDVERHNSNSYCLLDSTMEEQFKTLCEFGESYFKPRHCKIYYNYVEDRTDFVMQDFGGNLLEICFERRYPENDFEDTWPVYAAKKT